MTHFDTLVLTARQEPLTKSIAGWDWVRARLALLAKKLLNCVVT